MTNQFYWKLKANSFLYSRKRKESTKVFLASIGSIILALIVALLIATAMGYNPFTIIGRLFSIGFGDPTYFFYKIGVFALAGFAFYFAWKCGIINIGISGQMLLSGTIIVLITRDLGNQIPNGAGQIFIVFIGIVIGSLTATFIGVLNTYLKVNSIVASILLNWIIYFICFYILATYTVEPDTQFIGSGEIPLNYCLVDQNTNTGGIIPIIVIVVVLAIVMIIIFKFTVFGHKIKSIGLAKDASLYSGYNVKLLSLSSYAISGGISGILACVCYTSSSVNLIPLSTFFDAIPTEGFDGIMIALVGNNNPIGIILSSILFGLFSSSAQGLPTDPSFNNVITGCVLLGSAMSVLLYKLKPWMKLNSFKYDINYYESQLNFDNSMDSLLSKYYSILTSENNQIKNIKQQKDLNQLIALINEHHLDVAINNDFETMLKTYKQKRLMMLASKFDTQKREIIDQFNYQKLIDLIDARILTESIINKKKHLIDNKYDAKLTKYINSLKRKEESFIKKHQNQTTDLQQKHEIFINKKNQAINSNNQWKSKKIAHMIKYQNRYLNNQEKLNKQLVYIKQKTNELNNNEYKQNINNLLVSFNYQGGNQ